MNKHSERYKYDVSFYKQQGEGSYASAMKVLPMFMKNVAEPKSVLDVGCGVGTWLAAFRKLGVREIQGIDGSKIDDEFLYVPRDRIDIQDLEQIKSDGKKYDLAISLEVAEHISPENAGNFVKYLTDSSSLILFSAAIPHQDGANHINTRPLKYWADKFAEQGFKCLHIMRPMFFEKSDEVFDVEYWYLSNMIVFASGDALKSLEDKGFSSTKNPITIYHSQLADRLASREKVLKIFAIGKTPKRLRLYLFGSKILSIKI
jgi:SAM-dependent methyltransferase